MEKGYFMNHNWLIRYGSDKKRLKESGSFAFTLAEVLITLGIIGIVAAMTIPTLTRAYKLKILKTQLNQAYSIVSQSVKMLYAQSQLPPNYKNYPNNSFVNELKKYLKNGQICKTACTKHSDDDYYKSEDYVTLKGDVPADYSLMDEGQLTLNNGMLVMIQNSNLSNYGIMITVDINGINQQPNRWGIDLFTFKVMNDSSLIPMVNPDITYSDTANSYKRANTYCSLTSNAKQNGIACAFYALNDKCPWDSTKGYWECLPKF